MQYAYYIGTLVAPTKLLGYSIILLLGIIGHLLNIIGTMRTLYIIYYVFPHHRFLFSMHLFTI